MKIENRFENISTIKGQVKAWQRIDRKTLATNDGFEDAFLSGVLIQHMRGPIPFSYDYGESDDPNIVSTVRSENENFIQDMQDLLIKRGFKEKK